MLSEEATKSVHEETPGDVRPNAVGVSAGQDKPTGRAGRRRRGPPDSHLRTSRKTGLDGLDGWLVTFLSFEQKDIF